MTEDIWVISCYSNPLGYRTRRDNFEKFAASIARQGANLLMIEMAALDGEFDLDDSIYNCVRVRGNGLIWQKERLLNLALPHLPANCRKVVWADCDIIFTSDDWLANTSAALESEVVVQPFSQSVRLPYGHLQYAGETQEESGVTASFAYLYKQDPSLSRAAQYRNHGHTGYVWAAQRDFLETCGLYDSCMTGSNDHLMAHVFAGALESPCIPAMIGDGLALRHFSRWAEQAHALCAGRLGFVPGMVLHLWHGSLGNRRYYQRNQELKTFNFDPDKDLQLDGNGLWAWADESSHLRAWSEDYFKSRNEDDVDEVTVPHRGFRGS